MKSFGGTRRVPLSKPLITVFCLSFWFTADMLYEHHYEASQISPSIKHVIRNSATQLRGKFGTDSDLEVREITREY